jgi:hypothetical protein
MERLNREVVKLLAGTDLNGGPGVHRDGRLSGTKAGVVGASLGERATPWRDGYGSYKLTTGGLEEGGATMKSRRWRSQT